MSAADEDAHMPGTKRPRKVHNDHQRAAPATERGWAIVGQESVPLGPGITCASIEEVLAAIEGLDRDLSWGPLQSSVIPLFQRVRPYPVEFPEAVRTIVPPGL